MKSRHIVILTHKDSPGFARSTYYLRVYADVWREQGHQVSVACGVDNFIPGDVVIVHVDLTDVPAEYLDYASQYQVAINGEAKTIAKDAFSINLLHRNSDYKGKVIVKTNSNCGGMREALLRYRSGDSLAVRGVGKRPWRKVEYLDTKNYPIFNSTVDVPTGIWKNPRLVVEKFLPETDGNGNYYLRCWYFFGESNHHCHLISKKPIIKEAVNEEEEQFELESENNVKFQAQTVPKELHDMRRKMGMDFGMMDWGLHEGQAVIYDINKTPTLGKELLSDPEIMAMEMAFAVPMATRLKDYL